MLNFKGARYLPTTRTKTLYFGVIRPGCDVEGWTRMRGLLLRHVTYSGNRFPGDHDWEGMQTTRRLGGRIGMLLNLDQGSMTVWKHRGH